MPVGVIIDSLSVVLGGLAGTVIASRLSTQMKENLNMIFGLCSMGMGISSIVLMENMPAVVFAVIVGTAIGIAIHLGDKINKAAGLMQGAVSKIVSSPTNMSEEEFMATLVTIIVLFCASGTGIYGSIVAGMTGDHSILIAKSVLDFFTALIFAGTLGAVVMMIAAPQFLILLALFLLAGVIYPMTTTAMINDFKAAGGFLLLATGFRIVKLKMFPTADMLPSMILVMPVSWFWTAYILPLVS